MRTGSRLALLAAGLGLLPALAQVADYASWDRLFAKVDAPLAALAPTGDLTLLLYHGYPGSLHHLTLAVRSEAVELVGAPPVLALVPPTEIQTVKLHLRRRPAATGDTASLTLTLSAADVSTPHDLTLVVPLTAAGARRVNQALAVPAGQIPLVVTYRGELTYLLQTVSVLALLAWLLWRKRRLARAGAA